MKTTIAGVLTIIGAVIGVAIHVLTTGALPDMGTLSAAIAAVAAGWGLIKATDAPTP